MSPFYWFVEFLISFLESIIFFDFCDLFSHKKYPDFIKYGSSVLLSLITIWFNSQSFVSFLFSFLLMVLYWLIQCVIRKGEFLKLMFITIFYFFFVFIIDFIFSSILAVLTGTQVYVIASAQSMLQLRLAMAMSSKVSLLLLVSIMSKFRIAVNESNKKYNLILGISGISITIISLLMYLDKSEIIKKHSQLFQLLFFLMLLFLIMVIYFTIGHMTYTEAQLKETQLIAQQEASLINNMKVQEKNLVVWKKSIHDYKHKMYAIEMLLQQKKYAELEQFVNNEIKIIKDKAYYVSTGCGIVDIVVNSKMNYAKENNIIFTVNILIDQNIPLSDYDMCIILGNLIDNAIEAAQKSEKPVVHIQMNFVKNKFVIKIINSYSGDVLKLSSSKSESNLHGIGLKSVEQTVERYNGSFTLQQDEDSVSAVVVV